MGWSIGYDSKWQRDIGYGVPGVCDDPACAEKIDRGLSYVCGGEPYGGDEGCGLYFCSAHLYYTDGFEEEVCDRCVEGKPPFEPKPDTQEWIDWKMTDESWAQWRKENGLA
jgi:hypothetical protein